MFDKQMNPGYYTALAESSLHANDEQGWTESEPSKAVHSVTGVEEQRGAGTACEAGQGLAVPCVTGGEGQTCSAPHISSSLLVCQDRSFSQGQYKTLSLGLGWVVRV